MLLLSLFFSGHLYSTDDASKLGSAINLIRDGTFEIYEFDGAWGIDGVSGKSYPIFPIGSILIMIPPVSIYKLAGYAVGQPLPHYFLSVLVTFMNLTITAVSGWLIFLLCTYCGKSVKESIIFSTVVLFSTALLPYSQTGWSEPSALLFALLGFILMAVGMNKRIVSNKVWFFWSVCCSVAWLIRIELIAFFLFFVLVNILQKKISIKEVAVVMAVFSVAAFMHGWFNHYRFGSVFNFGYFGTTVSDSNFVNVTAANSFTIEFVSRYAPVKYASNFVRIYLSFGRLHWFWLSPLIGMIPVIIYFKKEIPPFIKNIFSAALIYMLILPGLGTNSWCWANRYMYTIFTFLIIPLLFIWKKNRGLKNAFSILAIAGTCISVMGSIVNYHVVLEDIVEKYGFRYTMRYYTETFFTAPFWHHLYSFPSQFTNTVALAFKGNKLPPWSELRSTCLDIWPVGLCGAGVNSFISFGLYFLLLAGTILYIKQVIQPLLAEKENGLPDH